MQKTFLTEKGAEIEEGRGKLRMSFKMRRQNKQLYSNNPQLLCLLEKLLRLIRCDSQRFI